MKWWASTTADTIRTTTARENGAALPHRFPACWGETMRGKWKILILLAPLAGVTALALAGCRAAPCNIAAGAGGYVAPVYYAVCTAFHFI